METGHPSTRAVNSDSGNRALTGFLSVFALYICILIFIHSFIRVIQKDEATYDE